MAVLLGGPAHEGPAAERAQLDAIEAFYRRRLTGPAVLPWAGGRWEPVRVGPTWQTETVLGVARWVLPQRSLGWSALSWCGFWLQKSRGTPWVFTDEQARFLLHWYSVEPGGRWSYRDFVLQRLKGHGKDPLGACLCLFEMLGPCRVADLDGDRVIGEEHPEAWVQTAAVAQKQTKNTMNLLPGLLTPECRDHYQVSPAKQVMYAMGATRTFEAITSSPETLEGARSTFTLKNETQHWLETNSGLEMDDVIERNATKSPGGASRTGAITNAFEQGMDSVAERARDAYEASEVAGKAASVRLLYDSLEAHPDAPLTMDEAPSVIESVRGDSVWLDIPSIVDSIADTRNPPSRSRRFWYNQVRAAEDAWVNPRWWDACAQPGQLVLPGERVVLFFDGSKSDDTTGLVGCRLSDGLVWRVGCWWPTEQVPLIDRQDVDAAVEAAFDTWAVVAFFGDPSHALDDEAESYWDNQLDVWHGRYARKLLLHANPGGDRQHSIMWDMSSHTHAREFTLAAQQTAAEIEHGQLVHDGDKLLRQHVFNSRKRTNKWGTSLGKASRDSKRKVDLAVCVVGARMVRRLVINKGAKERQRSGNVW